MADKVFKLEIVTPRKVVYAGDASSFTAPGVVGGFQVLFNHAPLLSELSVGEVKFRDSSDKLSRYSTSGGVVQVFSNRVLLLADTAERADEIDVARAEKARTRAEQRLQERSADLDVARATLALARAINRLRIAQSR